MNPITQTKVTINTVGEKVVQWFLTPNYKYTTPINFYIDWARSGGDWVEVAGPLSNVCEWTDPDKYNWNKDRDLYYRVRFTDAGEEHIGKPGRAGDGFLNTHDWLIFREIQRKECLLLTKYTGMPGEFLRRKHWGSRCPTCLDYDTRDVANGSCTSCLGTGFVGGYYPSVQMPAIQVTQPKTYKQTAGGLGNVDDKMMWVKVMACPMPDTYDLWVHVGNNDRYVIQEIDPIASYKGIPITLRLQLQKLPYTDIVYQTPVDISAQLDPVTPGLDNGWRPNLDNEY